MQIQSGRTVPLTLNLHYADDTLNKVSRERPLKLKSFKASFIKGGLDKQRLLTVSIYNHFATDVYGIYTQLYSICKSH